MLKVVMIIKDINYNNSLIKLKIYVNSCNKILIVKKLD